MFQHIRLLGFRRDLQLTRCFRFDYSPPGRMAHKQPKALLAIVSRSSATDPLHAETPGFHL